MFARVREGLAKLALATGGLALALLLLEGATRLLGLRFPAVEAAGPSDRALWVYDATKGWFHRPHATGQAHLGGPDRADVRINGLGFRGGEVERRRDDRPRVTVLGDSFAFGVGVDEDHLFSTRLARELGVEVLNLAVSGYSTDQELILFEELGRGLRPDLVVLVMCDNDFDGNREDFAYRRYYKPYFETTPAGLVRRNVPVPRLDRAQEAKLLLARHSNLWNGLRSRRAESPLVRRVTGLFEVAVPHVSAAEPVALTFALVAALRARVEEAGAELLVLNTGHRGERTPLFQELRTHLRRASVRFLGMEGELGALRAERPQGHWDFGRDVHWNVDAHRRVAEVVASAVREQGLLGRWRTGPGAPPQ